jgi:redox-sensitive bicupin YhaK (pirin superfamily)
MKQLQRHIKLVVLSTNIDNIDRGFVTSNANATVIVALDDNTRIAVFGGTKLPEKRHLFWNFCSSNRDRIAHAIR